jgi:hypothetical protein
VGITIMALTRSTPTMRIATTVVSAVRSVRIEVEDGHGDPAGAGEILVHGHR